MSYSINRKQTPINMPKRQRLELKMLIMILSIINRFFCKYSLRISQTNPKINSNNIQLLRGVCEIDMLDNHTRYSPLSLADFLELHRMIQNDFKCINHLDCDLVFKSERVYRSDEKNRKDKMPHFICLEKNENGGWITKVLPQEYLDAHRDRYRIACLLKR